MTNVNLSRAPEVAATPASHRSILVGLGLFITLLNTLKPLAVDDAVYSLFAAHIAEHPLDPYGFRAWGVQEANSILAPPVFLYWWALAMRLFGDNPFLWKLWLLPINLLLVFALHALGRRFARGMEMVFVCMIALSAAVLPCINLMLDVPALALGLFAAVLFFRACSADSVAGAILAGLVAGIATQTKYTAFVALGIMLLYAARSGKWRLGLLASSLAGMMFVAWELLIAWRYGASHFWLGFMQFRAPLAAKLRLLQPLFGQGGSAMAAGLPLALAANRWSARVVWSVAGLAVLIFAFVAMPSGAFLNMLRDTVHLYPWPRLTSLLIGLIGAALLGSVAVIASRLVRSPIANGTSAARKLSFSDDIFLVLWLLLEIAGYFALSPYPATRRVLGVVVVAMLLTCRLASRTCQGRIGLVWGIVGVNFLLGLSLFAVDLNTTWAQKQIAVELARECRRQETNANVWYFGSGTFEFYGGRLGMRRVKAPEAAISAGDWVLVVKGFEPAFSRHPVFARCVREDTREWPSILPVRSEYQFGNVAIAREEGPQIRVTRYRVR